MKARRAWHEQTAEHVLATLRSSPAGLTSPEARVRYVKLGSNTLPRARRKTALELIVRQTKNPLALVLLGSGLLAFALGKPMDGAVVVAVVLLNTFIGAFQEYRAERAVDALDALVPEKTTVLRDEQPTSVPVAQVVPGDVVVLLAGDRVPADLRVLSSRALRVDESLLTGESTTVAKQVERVASGSALADRACMLFSATTVASGAGQGVAVATGASTELGRISDLLRHTGAVETPLTRALAKFGRTLTLVICGVAVLIFQQALVRHYPLLEAVRTAVSFACAAIPEGLVAVMTITLTVAVRRMARRNAVIRTLPAVETLGSTTVICTDKTGTLTRGEMTVRRICTGAGEHELTGVGYTPMGELRRDGEHVAEPPREVIELLRAGLLCNEGALRLRNDGRWTAVGDPIEVALIVAALKVGMPVQSARRAWRRVDVVPFEAKTRYMASLHERPEGGQIVFLKGAPEVILQRCTESASEGSPSASRAMIDAWAASGLRVLAIASYEPPSPLACLASGDIGPAALIGLVGMIDPPRPETIAAIGTCYDAGIEVKMISGDHPQTALAVGVEIGLIEAGARVVTGAEIERMDARQLEHEAERSNVFARVEPEHKLRLVQALQARGEVVAMTGDGVNDAPALKQADVGIAMGISGTAAAREAADMILVDDNFATIAGAVEEGRGCYDNLMKALTFLLPTNLGQALIVIAGVFAFPVVQGVPVTPLVPLQILWVNLVTGVTLALPLAFELPKHDLMDRSPRAREQALLTGELARRTAIVGVLMAAGGIGIFLYDYYGSLLTQLQAVVDPTIRKSQTMTATAVVLFQIFYLFPCRSLRSSGFSALFSNPMIYAGTLTTLGMQAGFVHLPALNAVFHSAPLTVEDWLLSAAVAGTVLPVVALEKSLQKWRDRRGEARASHERSPPA